MNQIISRGRIFSRFVASVVCAGVFALAFISGASAQWRWVDESGTIHMSDKAPPPSVPDNKILSRPDPNRPSIQQRGTRIVGGTDEGSQPATANVSANDRKLEEERARIAAEQAKAEEDRKREDALKREQACENAKNRVLLYQMGGRLKDVNSKGETYYLSSQEIDERKKIAEADQREYCNSQ